ncbi:hypothetical protein HMI50_43055, partial [Corallococcus carmarthensis]|nr:hypothetical protein [Corallococcus carmarthensis]
MRVAERSAWTLFACALVLAVPSLTRAQSQEEKRRQLQERLGIKPPPEAPGHAQAAPDAGVVEPGTPSPAAPARATRNPIAARPRVPGFADDARPILEKACGSCHSPEGKASRSRWVLKGEPEDYDATVRFVQPATAAQSPLLKKGTGTALHGGKKVLAVESVEYATLLRWIEGGAPPGRARAGTQAAPVASAPSASSPVPTAPSASASPSSPSTEPSASASTSSSPTAPAASASAGSSPTAPAASASPSPPSTTPSASASAGTPPTAPSEDASAAPRFAPQVHEALLADCSSCHASDGMAGASRYLTHTDPDAHLRSVAPLVVPGAAASSLLYQRAKGDSHPGGAVWEPGSAQLALLARWIDAGALGTTPPATANTAVA